MKIFITGATGGLGKKLISLLCSEKYELILLSQKKNNPFTQKNVQIVTGDLLDVDLYKETMKNIDVIIHMAAITHTNDERLYYKVNTNGTKLLASIAKQYGIKRFIFISTRAIGKEGGVYSNSKRLAENIVKNSGLAWTIVSPAEIYGISEKEAINRLIKNIEKMPVIPVIGQGKHKIAPVYVDDIIDAIIKILENENTVYKTYNLSGPEEMSYRNFVDKVLELKKLKKVKINIPVLFFSIIALLLAFFKVKKPFIVKDQIPRLLCKKSADITLAKKDLGYQPKTINQVIGKEIDTY